MKRAVFAAFLLLVFAAGCASGPPRSRIQDSGPETAAAFSHADWDAFLKRHVDSQGRIDYTKAATDRADLDRYLAALAETSPDHNPERFASEADRLAYWINAYNAQTIGLVLAHYPIDSVIDVRPPWLFRFLPEGAGFFVFQKIVLGDSKWSLYALENDLIRQRFAEPRIHFALNCASASCPRLPAEAFDPARLEEQLARETQRFLADERNYVFDEKTGRVLASAIFDWYEKDFVDWVKNHGTEGDVSQGLQGYFEEHLPSEARRALERCERCPVDFRPYDWGLNDRRGGDQLPKVSSDS